MGTHVIQGTQFEISGRSWGVRATVRAYNDAIDCLLQEISQERRRYLQIWTQHLAVELMGSGVGLCSCRIDPHHIRADCPKHNHPLH